MHLWDFYKLTDVRKSSLLVKGQGGVGLLMFDMQEDSPLMRLFFSDLNSLNPLISMRVALWLGRRSLDRVSVHSRPLQRTSSIWFLLHMASTILKLLDSMPLFTPSHMSPSCESQWIFWCFIHVYISLKLVLRCICIQLFLFKIVMTISVFRFDPSKTSYY